MLIDCDTCTARGTGCADCVVTVLLGAPPGWQGVDPVVVPMPARTRSPRDAWLSAPEVAAGAATAEDAVVRPPRLVVDIVNLARRAVRALAEVGLVPPLRHRGASDDGPGSGRRTG
jgi:hypothetical protein